MTVRVNHLAPNVSTDFSISELIADGFVFDTTSCYVLPGLVDVHVHLREPGFSYKETIASGTAAAAAGGYTAVCSMPNLRPCPDTPEHLDKQLRLIRQDACIDVFPYGTITVEEAGRELSEMDRMAPNVVAFSDDGRGVQDTNMMRRAMLQAKACGKIIAAHCEDNSLLHGGCIHAGDYAAAHGFPGILSESEYGPIARDIQLAAETGCAYHVCHISTKESVALIREAKKAGVNITCETAPHYLLMDDSMLEDDGRFKMNPPLRSSADREALLAGILDGTIDMIATDHAPHSAEEKSGGLRGSAFGVVGLETAFPILYTHLVKPGILPLARLVQLMSDAPAHRFQISRQDSFAVFRRDVRETVDPAKFRSMGKSSPFQGWQTDTRCVLNIVHGKVVYDDHTLPRKENT